MGRGRSGRWQQQEAGLGQYPWSQVRLGVGRKQQRCDKRKSPHGGEKGGDWRVRTCALGGRREGHSGERCGVYCRRDRMESQPQNLHRAPAATYTHHMAAADCRVVPVIASVALPSIQPCPLQGQIGITTSLGGVFFSHPGMTSRYRYVCSVDLAQPS